MVFVGDCRLLAPVLVLLVLCTFVVGISGGSVTSAFNGRCSNWEKTSLLSKSGCCKRYRFDIKTTVKTQLKCPTFTNEWGIKQAFVENDFHKYCVASDGWRLNANSLKNPGAGFCAYHGGFTVFRVRAVGQAESGGCKSARCNPSQMAEQVGKAILKDSRLNNKNFVDVKVHVDLCEESDIIVC